MKNQRKNDVATNTTETFSGDHLIGELKKVIEKKNTHTKQNKRKFGTQ